MRNIAVSVERSTRGRVVPSDNEDASPNKVNSFRPRYTKMPSANLPEMVKPDTDMEEIDICTYQDGRGGWRERASKERSQYLGDPSRCRLSEVDCWYGLRESHNPNRLRRRKSERLIRIMTRGNACRVKELCRYCVYRIERSSA
jgi:hypothetical protein